MRQDLAKDFSFPIPDQSKESARSVDLEDIEIIFGTWDVPCLDRAFLNAAPKLRAVFYAAGSVKDFATREASERGIAICSAWRANAIPVAEYTLSIILLSLKKFWQASRPVFRKTIDNSVYAIPGAFGAKVGLVSLGAIGARVAELLKGFDLEVMAYDPFIDPMVAKAMGARLVSLETLFRECEIVSIHAPLLPQTTRMINAAMVNSMRPGATLINTARGDVLDEIPVLEVLRARPDLTAILDVAAPEPPARNSLMLELENVIYTPHIAGSHGREIARMGYWMAEEAWRFITGRKLLHEVTSGMLEKAA